MKKLIIAILIVFGFSTVCLGANFYPATVLTGGGTGALDKIDGAGLADGDIAIVAIQGLTGYGNFFAVYVLDADSAETEASPWIITPDTNGGDKRWVLISSNTLPPVVITSGRALTIHEVRTGYIQMTVAGTITLPKASTVGYGSDLCIQVRDASETCIIEVDAADKIFLPGTGALDAGDTIDSPGNAGDFVCLVSSTDTDGSGTDGWWIVGFGQAAWTDGGAT